jgi:hypothetical protein
MATVAGTIIVLLRSLPMNTVLPCLQHSIDKQCTTKLDVAPQGKNWQQCRVVGSAGVSHFTLMGLFHAGHSNAYYCKNCLQCPPSCRTYILPLSVGEEQTIPPKSSFMSSFSNCAPQCLHVSKALGFWAYIAIPVILCIVWRWAEVCKVGVHLICSKQEHHVHNVVETILMPCFRWCKVKGKRW